MNHKFVGASEGFIVNQVIWDADYDTQGFVGYLPSDDSIYVVFRGTESITNWMADLTIIQAQFEDANCLECWVHKGY